MKKTLALSLLIPFALVSSCEKQDSTAEQQLAQRKTELDAREKALDEREKAMAERQTLVVKPRVAPLPRTAPVPRTAPADPDIQDLMGKMEELQKRRVPASRSSQATGPATEQASQPSPSPTPE
jgi:septation ring formation regulator EzrA